MAEIDVSLFDTAATSYPPLSRGIVNYSRQKSVLGGFTVPNAEAKLKGNKNTFIEAKCAKCQMTDPKCGFAPIGEDAFGNLLCLCNDCWWAF